MPRKRALSGAGTVYREVDDRRQTRWVAEVVVTLPNGTKRRVRARARTAEEAVRVRDARATAIRVENPHASRMTVRDLSERWLAARAHDLKPSTVVTYRKSLDAYVLPALGAARVTAVTPMDVQTMVTAVLSRASGRNDMRAAADRARRVTSAMFAQAVRWQLVRANPADDVDAVRPAARERGYWTRDEAVRFLRAAEGEGYYAFFRLALETGLRLGELLALRWSDVEARHVVVRRTYSSDTRSILDTPKTTMSRRRVPIGADTLAALGARGRGADLVFASRSGRPLTPSSVRRAMDRIIAKVPGLPRIKLHDLRRTYASLLAADGFHPAVIQRLLGHASPDLAMRVYTSVNEESLGFAVVSLGGGMRGGYSGGDSVRQRGEIGGQVKMPRWPRSASRRAAGSSGARAVRRARRNS